MATRYIDFAINRDEFGIDGLYAICEPLLIEVSTGLHGFQIESVRLRLADDHAEAVPTFISDFIASWALTASGKAAIQAAYEAALPDDGQSYIYTAPAEHRSIWRVA